MSKQWDPFVTKRVGGGPCLTDFLKRSGTPRPPAVGRGPKFFSPQILYVLSRTRGPLGPPLK